MKKRLLRLIPLFLMAIPLTACRFDKADDSELISQGYNVIVTFDANGGKIGNYDDRKMYCKEESYIFPPGTNKLPAAVNDGVILEGWYRGTKDSDGQVVFGDKFDFETEKVTESITLYAKWVCYYTTTIIYGEKTKVINSNNKDEIVNAPTSMDWAMHTFLGYFKDEALTIPYDWSVAPEYDENQNVNVYTKWLDGNYVLVKEASNLKTIKANAKLYFMNDIDMEGATLKLPAKFTGIIVGNGYTLKNFTVSWVQSGTTDVSFGMFKEMEKATISDITFENATVNVEIAIGQNHKVGTFAGSVKETNISNTTLKNSKLVLTVKSESLKPLINPTGLFGQQDSASVIDMNDDNNTIEK